MKLEDVKTKIDEYFSKVPPEEIVNKFENWYYALYDFKIIEEADNL